MSPHPKFNPTALSFAYLRRGELPSVTPGFYRDAGLSRDDFQSARAGQEPPRAKPARFEEMGQGDDRSPRTLKHTLPDPRPSFAPPSRKLFEEDWFRKKRNRPDHPQPAQTKARRHGRKR